MGATRAVVEDGSGEAERLREGVEDGTVTSVVDRGMFGMSGICETSAIVLAVCGVVDELLFLFLKFQQSLKLLSQL